jgi:putative FmdB family regulatory protein
MPNYEYECESCGIRFERMQHFHDEPLKDCPECGGCVHRVLQPVGIVFKGSGFYVTDHNKSSSTASAARKDGGASKDSGEMAPTPGESKTPESTKAEEKKPEKTKAAD